MNGQKINSSRPYGRVNIRLLLAFFGLISFSNLVFSNNTFALFTPTLSASIDNTAASVNGNQVINSTNKTTEIPLNLTVNTNNKTGYTATLNSETNETALVNSDSTTGAKINSISSAGLLGDFSNNSWGYKIGSSTNYAPIPALSTPAQVIQTTGKTNGSEMNSIKIGMKLSDNLESGIYTNKLVFSILTNNYDRIAIMTEGPDFNAKLKALGATTDKIEHFKKSTVAPAASMNAVNIDDEESDYEIKFWLDPSDKIAYYYSEPEKVYLNTDSSKMFYSEFGEQKIRNIPDIDLSNFDTSRVKDMRLMFYNMRGLTTLNLSNFDTSQVTNMSSMFYYVSNLTTLNLSTFDTSRVTDMSYMFSYMSNLITIDLSSFNTSKVTNMYTMFSFVSNLTTLNLSNFDTSKVTNMNHMFYSMPNLITLDLSNFNTSQVMNMSYMFSIRSGDKLMDKLEKIYVNNDFDTAKLIGFSEIFTNRKKLRGGNGSFLENPFLADKTWLRVDRPGVQGYFTRKP